MQNEIRDTFSNKQLCISSQSLGNIKKMEYSRKKTGKNSEERKFFKNFDTRSEYASYMQYILDKKLIFTDETGFNLHLARNYRYSPKNSKSYKIIKGNKGINIACVVA